MDMRWLLLLTLSLPATACLNDSQVTQADAQFRSAYGDHPAAVPSRYPINGFTGFVMGVAASVLICAVIVRRRKA